MTAGPSLSSPVIRIACALMASGSFAVVACSEPETDRESQAPSVAPVTRASDAAPPARGCFLQRKLIRDLGDHVIEAETCVDGIEVQVHPRGEDAPRIVLGRRSRNLAFVLDKGRSLSGQRSALTRMVSAIYQHHAGDLADAGLNLDADRADYPAFYERLARHASRDTAWKKQTAAAPALNLERVLAVHVPAVANSERLHAELDGIFAPVGRRLRLHAAWRCRAEVPGADNADGRWLASLGLASKVPLPAGCGSLGFAIE